MTETTKLEEAIRAAEDRFTALFNSGDSGALAQMYSPYAELFPDDSEVVAGRHQIEAMFSSLFKDRPRISLTVKEVRGFGEFAYEVGAFTLVTPTDVEHGNYIVVWQRADTGWQLHRDIYNVVSRSPVSSAIA